MMNRVCARREGRGWRWLALLLMAGMACNLFAPSNTQATDETLAAASPTPTETSSQEVPTASLQPTEDVESTAFRSVCTGGTRSVALLVDGSLVEDVRQGLSQFGADLCAAGYQVLQTTQPFQSAEALREALAGLYRQTGGGLAGAILIGDLPHAYQQVRLVTSAPQSAPAQEVISFQYYADLDGEFGRSAGYSSSGGHESSYDLHTGEVDWEIWIGVLPLYQHDRQLTVAALERYFEKNHAYRMGQYDIPRRFLQINEHHSARSSAEHVEILEQMRSGTYAWTPFSLDPEALLYFDSVVEGFSVEAGYAQLSAGAADFTVGDAHGSWAGHGRIDIQWVESQPVNTVFFWSNGCAVGDLDQAQNFITAAVYSSTSRILVGKGTTSNSGGMGTNEEGFFGHNIASSMAAGSSFGDAILQHVNVPLIYPWSDSREFHFATVVVIGDPTLTLREE
jgi:hypothetical protein